jgi:RNA-directed DNA polymerase
MSLETPSKIRMWQTKLYRKAKAEPEYRFYLLYDKIYREDVLAHAYDWAKSNQGAPGVDEQTFEQIESQGLEEWLDGIGKEPREKTYKPQPVRRVMIPKPGGGERPPGIPTIRDRVVPTAAKLILEPILEADFDPDAYGYRPKRSAQDAIQKVHTLLCEGYTRCSRRGFVPILRYDSAPGTDAMRGPADRRWERAASDQDVVERSDRRAGRAGEQTHDGRQEQHLRSSARWCG